MVDKDYVADKDDDDDDDDVMDQIDSDNFDAWKREDYSTSIKNFVPPPPNPNRKKSDK